MKQWATMKDGIAYVAILCKWDGCVRDAKSLYKGARSIVAKPYSQSRGNKRLKHVDRRIASI
jgi:hypothetical protein